MQARPGTRGAIVAATAADARDVMIEGESGMLNVSRDRPIYEPSKRRLTWPNGAIATTFSADEPDRLRGPQFHWAVCDELCLAKGTLIITNRGNIPIEKVMCGDYALTRNGFRQVVRAWCSDKNAKVFEMTTTTGRRLVGTANHPIWIDGKGFAPLTSIELGDILMVWDIRRSQALFGMAAAGGSMADTTAIGAGSYCIAPFTPRPMGLFRHTLTSIIRTATRLITNYLTSLPSIALSILSHIDQEDGSEQAKRKSQKRQSSNGQEKNPIKSFARNVAKSIIQLERALNSVLENASLRLIEKGQNGMSLSLVSLAANYSENINTRQQCTVQESALDFRKANSRNKVYRVLSAAKTSTQAEQQPSVAQRNAAISTEAVLGINPLSNPQPVYNLEIEGEHEYFANGVLTHNCAWRFPAAFDMLMLGLRLGYDPRCAIATTPRPTEIIRRLVASPDTFTTRGSTYENRANLAEAFFSQIIGQYEGTRLGRQEINAEILEDVPGALWTRAMLDGSRVMQAPQLTRIVVAVDPEATATETSAETGIIVAGLGADRQGYVLDDRTIRAAPATWAAQAVAAYHSRRADRIVYEANQGGDMVAHTLQTVERDVPLKAVHASRGKQARAEPVAALYEQGRIHHVGVFTELEDQLCNWTPTNGQASPDRLDALVWALTELMVGAQTWVRKPRGAR